MDKVFGSYAGKQWSATLQPIGERRWFFESLDDSIRPKTLEHVRDEARLQKLLRRAVNSTYAPQSLVDSIKRSIRV